MGRVENSINIALPSPMVQVNPGIDTTQTACGLSLRAYVPLGFAGYRRPLEPIGNIPPAEAEEQYYAMIEQRPLVP